jgi:hypothetical protein
MARPRAHQDRILAGFLTAVVKYLTMSVKKRCEELSWASRLEPSWPTN